jgi:O-antigen/teichoic acid export membrane protein
VPSNGVGPPHGEVGPKDVPAAERDGAEASRDLGRGLLWLGSSNLLAKVLDALSALVVLRFLSREELGLATLAWATTTLAETFNGFGINGAVIQSPTLSETAKASAHWYAVCASTLLALLVYAAAPLIASVYDLPALLPLIRVSSIKLVLVGCANVPLAVASRGLRFERLGAIGSAATALASSLTILLAALGWGSWAPLLGNTAHGAFQLIGVTLLAPMSVRWTLSWASLKPLARTGWSLAGAGAASQVARNLDYWMLGRVAGAAVLGSYRVAFDMAMLPTYTVMQVASRSALPVYARLAQSPDRLATAIAWTARAASLVLLAPLLVIFLEGEAVFVAIGKAADTALLLSMRVLCVAAFVRAVTQFALPALIAAGYSRLAFFEALGSSAVLAACLALSLALFEQPDPQVRVSLGWFVACLLLVPFELLLARSLGRGIGGTLVKALQAPALVALGVVLGCGLLLRLSPLQPGVQRLAVHGVVILGVYALVIRHGLGMRLAEVRRFGKAPEAPAA